MRPNRAFCVLVIGAIAALALLIPAAASGAPALVITDYSNLDPREGARNFASSMAQIGYNTQTVLQGETARQAWDQGKNAAVYAVLNHSDLNSMEVASQPNTNYADYVLGTGFPGGNGTGVATCDAEDGVPLGSVYACYWGDYTRATQTDDMELAVLAGCNTATGNPKDGWPGEGHIIGIDSVVGWIQKTAYPAYTSGSATDNSNGNYFMSQFGAYLANGNTVANALSKAEADLIAKEGAAQRWDSWFVGGASATPGAVRVAPQGFGAKQGWDPLYEDWNPLNLSAASQAPQHFTVAGQRYTDHTTASGLAYRTDDAGNITWLMRPPTHHHAVSLATARRYAARFVSRRVHWYRATFDLVRSERTTHFGGQHLASFTWRPTTNGIAGPAVVTADVDLDAGQVVSMNASRAKPAHTRFAVTRDQAITAAHKAAEGTVTSARADVWRYPRWTVTVKRPATVAQDGARFPNVAYVEINGRTGRVVGVART